MVNWNLVTKGESGMKLVKLLPLFLLSPFIWFILKILEKYTHSVIFSFSLFYITDEEKRLNATYIISVARKLGCSIFLLPEDIMEV